MPETSLGKADCNARLWIFIIGMDDSGLCDSSSSGVFTGVFGVEGVWRIACSMDEEDGAQRGGATDKDTLRRGG